MRATRTVTATLAASFLLATAITGAAAQSDEPMEGEPFHIGYFAAFTSHDWAAVGYEAARQAAEEHGGTIELFDAQFDSARQYNQIQDATASGRFDGYIIMVQDGASIVPAIEEAVAAGIKVVDYAFGAGTDLESREPQVEGMTGSVTLSYLENGQQIADIAIGACEGVEPPCKVALLAGSLSVAADAKRIEVIQDVLAEVPDIEVAAVAETTYTVDGAYGVAKDILTANPDLGVFAAIGSEGVNGAERAVEEAGLTSQVKLGGGGCSQNSTDAVREGRWFACYRGTPIDDNRMAVELIVKSLRGEPIEDVSPNAAELAGWPPIVTAENIGDLQGQWND
jgi:ribose transport system substrate-binding protein